MMILSRFFNRILLAVLTAFPCLTIAQSSLDFITGKALFEKNWVPAPASTQASDGLGPYYNARSCNQCHPEGGSGSRQQSLVLHLNDPVYGQQLQKYAVPGLAVEAIVEFTLDEKSSDYSIKSLHSGPMHTMATSPRLASSLHGLGLLEAVPESGIAALADEHDVNGDGISGRINRVNGTVGRFGWKASRASLDAQVARALSLDLGLGNPLHPSAYGDCTSHQLDCLARPHGNSSHHDNLEANTTVLDLILAFVRGLPAPGQSIPKVQSSQGRELFNAAGCAACHVPALQAGDIIFYPYTDLLLHDMGPGLADSLVEGSALGNEWRTAPLWGLGQKTTEYLHDGRAQTLDEAIRWHDGEAGRARKNYEMLSSDERNDLFAFLIGL